MNQENFQNKPDRAQSPLDRRRFLSTAGVAGLGLAAAGVGLSHATPASAATTMGSSSDTVKEIVTAILIAEDLATVFYYNALVGSVIQNPNLAGSGGTATHVSSSGNVGNVKYVRAALSEEIAHATLARTILGKKDPSSDPYQTFYFPSGTFTTLAGFTGILDALENAFIGAYLNGIQEFSTKAAIGGASGGAYTDLDGSKYSSLELIYFAKVAASIMGVESEHRVLGRVISSTDPANNRNFETLDNLNAVYNGKMSAVAALTPFLTPSTGAGFHLASALANQSSVSLAVQGGPPSPY